MRNTPCIRILSTDCPIPALSTVTSSLKNWKKNYPSMFPFTEAELEADLLWGFLTKAHCQLLWDEFKDLSYPKSPKVGWSKAISGNLRQREENWSFRFPFSLSVHLSLVCAVWHAPCYVSKAGQWRAHSQRGHCYRGTSCTAKLFAYPVPPTTLPLQAALLHTPKSSSQAGTLRGTQRTEQESPGKAQALALCNPHLPEPEQVVELRDLDHVRSPVPVPSLGSKAGVSSLSPNWERFTFVDTERESEPVQPSINPCLPPWCCYPDICSAGRDQLNLCCWHKTVGTCNSELCGQHRAQLKGQNCNMQGFLSTLSEHCLQAKIRSAGPALQLHTDLHRTLRDKLRWVQVPKWSEMMRSWSGSACTAAVSSCRPQNGYKVCSP